MSVEHPAPLTSTVLDALHGAHHRPGNITMLELAEHVARAVEALLPKATTVEERAVRSIVGNGDVWTGEARPDAEESARRLASIWGEPWPTERIWLVCRTVTTFEPVVGPWETA